MATDNFSSMFGMASPEQAQQAYLAQAQKRNMELAQLGDPNKIAFAMMGNIGSRLGAQAGRMFGGQTAMESEQAVMKDIFNKAAAQSSDPVERLEIAATMFDSVDPAKAQALRDKAMEFKKSTAEVEQKGAAARAAAVKEERAKKIAVALKSKFPDMPEEALMGLATNDKLIAELFKPENIKKKYDTVTTKEGVFMVNEADPTDKIRIGDAKVSAMDALAGEMAAARLEHQKAQTQELKDKAQVRLDKATEAKESAIKTLANSETQIDNSLLTAQEAEDLAPKNWLGGLTQAAFSELPWSEQKALKNLVASLNSEKVISTMMELKNQSRTGATGFGALSEKELDLLLAKTRQLDPTSKTFKADLKFVTDEWRRVKGLLRSQREKLLGLGGEEGAKAGAGGKQRTTASGVKYTVE